MNRIDPNPVPLVHPVYARFPILRNWVPICARNLTFLPLRCRMRVSSVAKVVAINVVLFRLRMILALTHF